MKKEKNEKNNDPLGWLHEDLEEAGPSGFCPFGCLGFHSLSSHFYRLTAAKDSFLQDPLTLPSSLLFPSPKSRAETWGGGGEGESGKGVEEKTKDKSCLSSLFLYVFSAPNQQTFQNSSI